MRWPLIPLAAFALLWPTVASAHPVRLGVLSIREGTSGLVEVRFRISGTEVAPAQGVVVLPDACEPVAAERRSAIPFGEERRLTVRCAPGALDAGPVGVRDLAGPAEGVQVHLRVERADGEVVRAVLDAEGPTLEPLVSAADPIQFYIALGATHVLGGFDHLLFVFGLLVLLWSRPRLLLATITAFTVGHSITLALAAVDLVRAPRAPIELLIAASVLLLGVELARRDRDDGLTARWPWAVAAAFGLLHGLGFASALAETGLPRDGAIPALFAFNVGVELGQLLFVGLFGAALWLVRRTRLPAPPRWVAPYLMGSVAAYWTVSRAVDWLS